MKPSAGGRRDFPRFRERSLRWTGGRVPDERTRCEAQSLDLDRHETVFAGGELCAVLQRLPWESSVFRRACWNLHLGVPAGARRALPKVLRQCRRKGLVWVRVASSHRRLIRDLRRRGFEPLVEMVNLQRALPPGKARRTRGSPAVRSGRPSDARSLVSLARRIFSFDRYHSDRRIRPGRADEAHAQWARNSLAGKVAEETLVSEREGRVAGFHVLKTVEWKGRKVGVTVLIGVDRAFAGRGIGRALLEAGLAWMRKRGCRRAWVRTEVRNAAANRLYHSLGFRETGRFWYLRRFRS